MLFLCIFYLYSCKTHNISSKLGFSGFLWKASDSVRKEAKSFQKESYLDVSPFVIEKINFYISSKASNGSTLLMDTFYIQRDFQRHLTSPNPSSNKEVMASTSWTKKTVATEKTLS